MTPEAIAEAASVFLEAQRLRRRLPGLPAHLVPSTTDDAEAICDAFGAGLPQPIGGWKVGAVDPSVPIKLGLERPFLGPIPESLIYQSGARVPWSDLMRPVVEPEIGLRLARDLPPRDRPYSRAEVADAIATLHPGIEIPESRLTDDHKLGALGMVADLDYAGRYVVGPAIADWRRLDLPAISARLLVSGREVARGVAAKAFGNPLDGVVWLANALPRRGTYLKAGEIVSTGSLTGIQRTKAGDTVVADYGPLGEVRLTMT